MSPKVSESKYTLTLAWKVMNYFQITGNKGKN